MKEATSQRERRKKQAPDINGVLLILMITRFRLCSASEGPFSKSTTLIFLVLNFRFLFHRVYSVVFIRDSCGSYHVYLSSLVSSCSMRSWGSGYISEYIKGCFSKFPSLYSWSFFISKSPHSYHCVRNFHLWVFSCIRSLLRILRIIDLRWLNRPESKAWRYSNVDNLLLRFFLCEFSVWFSSFF